MLLPGCMSAGAGSGIAPQHLDVFGVRMFSKTDYREINGVKGVDEPCLRGYERTFDALDIVIGYGKDGAVRKITIRNPKNSLFGIHPGDNVSRMQEAITTMGFVNDGRPYRFNKGNVSLTVRSDATGEWISSLTLEEAVQALP
jgi:hypothetical protein